MEFQKGYLIVGHWRDAPVKLNWTIFLTPIFFGRFEFVPFFWISFFILVFIHEAGHVFIIQSYRLWTEEIVIHGLGGYCRWIGDASEVKQSVIAWGGIIAQLIVLAIAWIITLIFGPPKSLFMTQIHHAFIHTNYFLILFNLIPVEPLDGAHAWKIIRPLRETISEKKYEY